MTIHSAHAAHSGAYGLGIHVGQAFDHDWHAQVVLQDFHPPTSDHGYILSFWARANAIIAAAAHDHPNAANAANAATGPGNAAHGRRELNTANGAHNAANGAHNALNAAVHDAANGAHNAVSAANAPVTAKLVFQDADDQFAPVMSAPIHLTAIWHHYHVPITIPAYREGHRINIAVWVGSHANTLYNFDEFKVSCGKLLLAATHPITLPPYRAAIVPTTLPSPIAQLLAKLAAPCPRSLPMSPPEPYPLTLTLTVNPRPNPACRSGVDGGSVLTATPAAPQRWNPPLRAASSRTGADAAVRDD